MHIAFLCVQGNLATLNKEVLGILKNLMFSNAWFFHVLFQGFTNNRIGCLRLKGLSTNNFSDLKIYSFSGVLVRSVGIALDIRIGCSYEIYSCFINKVFISYYGDAFDKFLLRCMDNLYSISLCKKTLLKIKGDDFKGIEIFTG
jgi:NADH-quinone oxidoreductase subunit D